jgi:hypothetical protein
MLTDGRGPARPVMTDRKDPTLMIISGRGAAGQGGDHVAVGGFCCVCGSAWPCWSAARWAAQQVGEPDAAGVTSRSAGPAAAVGRRRSRAPHVGNVASGMGGDRGVAGR